MAYRNRFPRSFARGGWALTACALLAFVAFAATAGARPFGHGHGGPLSKLEEVVPNLGLDAEAEEAVYAELDAARDNRRASRDEVKAAHEYLRDLLEQEQPDVEAVMTQAEVVGALMTEIRKESLGTMLRVRALLDSEQRERLRELVALHRGARGDCRDRGES